MAGVYVAAVVVIEILVFISILVLSTRDKKSKPVLNKRDAKLYRDAAKILGRMINTIDISGNMPADVLSEKTSAEIRNWLYEYQKELGK